MKDIRLWYGHATVEPSAPVVAGSHGTWRLTYIAGRYGIDNSGAIIICWRFAIDWGRPQTDDPKGENYLTASTDAEAKLKVTYTFKGYTRPWYHAVRVDVYDGEIRPGERITLTFGDTRYGSIGQRAPTAVNKRCEWKVSVDPFCTRRFVSLQDRPSLEIISDDPVRLAAILPSDAVCGERMRVLIRAEDKWGNPASGYRGGAYLVWELSYGALEGLSPKREGIFRLRLYDERLGLDCPSNPCG